MLINKDYQNVATLQAISEFPYAQQKLYLLLSDKYRGKNVSQQRLADEIGMSLSTVKRYLKQFRELKLFNVVQRPGFTYETCTYTPTNIGLSFRARITSLYNTSKGVLFSISLLVPGGDRDELPIKLRGESYDSTPLNPSLFLNPSPTNPSPTVTESYGRAREREAFSKKERVMTDLTTRKAINEIKSLKLTQWGVIRLHAFSDQAIRYADFKLRSANASKLRDAYSYFVTLCLEEDRRIGNKPNNDLVQALYREYNAPFDRQYTEPLDRGLDFKKDGLGGKKEGLTDEQKILKQERDSDRRAEGLALEHERMREKQRTWEASKTPEQLQECYQRVFPVVEGMMTKFGAESSIVSEVKSRLFSGTPSVPHNVPRVTVPTHVNQDAITPQDIAWLDTRFDVVRKLLKKSELNEFEQILVHNFQVQIEEAKSKFKIVDRWIIDLEDGNPTWSPEDKELIDWAIPFLRKSTSFTKSQYDRWIAEIELGPESPRAVTRELQDGLALLRTITNNPGELIAQPVSLPVTNPTTFIECAPIDEIDDANLGRLLEATHEVRSSYDTTQPVLGDVLPVAMGTSTLETGRSEPVQTSLFRSATSG